MRYKYFIIYGNCTLMWESVCESFPSCVRYLALRSLGYWVALTRVNSPCEGRKMRRGHHPLSHPITPLVMFPRLLNSTAPGVNKQNLRTLWINGGAGFSLTGRVFESGASRMSYCAVEISTHTIFSFHNLDIYLRTNFQERIRPGSRIFSTWNNLYRYQAILYIRYTRTYSYSYNIK